MKSNFPEKKNEKQSSQINQKFPQRKQIEKLEKQAEQLENELMKLTQQLDQLRTKNQKIQEDKDEEVEYYKKQVYEIQNKLQVQETNSKNEINILQNTLKNLESDNITQQQLLKERNQKLLDLQTKQKIKKNRQRGN